MLYIVPYNAQNVGHMLHTWTVIKLDLTTIKQDLRVQEQDPQKNALDKLVHINEKFGLYE